MSNMNHLYSRIREFGAADLLKRVSNKIMRCRTDKGRERLQWLADELCDCLHSDSIWGKT